MCPKKQQTSDNLIVKNYCFIIEIFDKFTFSGILQELTFLIPIGQIKGVLNFKILCLDSYFWQSNYNWVVDRRNMPVEDLIKSQLQSEEEFTDQRSSHFKLCMAVNFKSLL